MTVRAIFAECSTPLWLEVASELASRQGWQPVYWVATPTFEEPVTTRFPDAIFHANLDAVKGIVPSCGAAWPLPPVDQDLLEDLARCESVALRMMDRMDPDDSFGYSERLRLYHRHVQYWLGVLENLRPNVVVFPTAPHLVYDYVLYELCKRRGIRTLLFNESAVAGLVYSIPQFEDGAVVLTSTYRQLLAANREAVLSPRVRTYLQKVRGDYEAGQPGYIKGMLTPPRNASTAPTGASPQSRLRKVLAVWKYPRACVAGWRAFTSARMWRKLSMLLEGWRLTFRYTTEVIRMVSRDGALNRRVLSDAVSCTVDLYRALRASYAPGISLADPAPLSYLKQRGEPPERASFTGLEYWLYRLMAQNKKLAMKEHYERLARAPDCDRPYVYVPLHYQPEKSTSPEGGVYASQFLLVDLLAKCLPPGWMVYVKEHPFQFEVRGSGEMTRTTQFYDDLAALPNVALVPESLSPFDLIDRARAVATGTGTSGWEAVIRGKPVLTFGHAWYNGCEGVFHTPTEASCRAALAQIEAGYIPDARKVLLFVQTLEQLGFQGFTIPELADAAEVNEEANVRGFTQAIERMLQAPSKAA